MRRQVVEVEVVLLHVLAMVALRVGQAEEPLLQDRVPSVPQSDREAQDLLVVALSGQAVLAPPVRPGARLVVREVRPGVSVVAVVLPYRAPLALAQVRAPPTPRHPGTSFLEPGLLRPDAGHLSQLTCARVLRMAALRHPGRRQPSQARTGDLARRSSVRREDPARACARHRAGKVGRPVTTGAGRNRDLGAFDRRAESYDQGRLGYMHQEICDRVVTLALFVHPYPRRVLDVGCGTGYFLRALAQRIPETEAFSGVDPAPNMVGVSRSAVKDPRVRFDLGAAERLPYPDRAFDLVVSTTSFDHWADQSVGLRECARVLSPGGHLLLTDQFSELLWPTLISTRRQKARTRRRVSRLLLASGFEQPRWRRLYAVIISSVVVTKAFDMESQE